MLAHLFLTLLSRPSGAALPAIPGPDYELPIDVTTSGIATQAFRFCRLPPPAAYPDQSEQRQAAAQALPDALEACLGAADWSFASTLVHLPQSVLPAGVIDDGRLPVVYRLPGNLLVLREVKPAGTVWRIDRDVLRANGTAPLTIRYTARMTREDRMPATFHLAVSLHMAVLIGARFSGDDLRANNIADHARLTLKDAMRQNARTAAAASWRQDDEQMDASHDDWATGAVA